MKTSLTILIGATVLWVTLATLMYEPKRYFERVQPHRCEKMAGNMDTVCTWTLRGDGTWIHGHRKWP